MRKMTWLYGVACSGVLLSLTGCETRHTVVIEPKPIEVNINISGKLELVITDARKNLDYIMGTTPSGPSSRNGSAIPAPQDPSARVLQMTVAPASQPAVEDKQAILDDLRVRFPKIRALLDAKLVGESHTGLVVARSELQAEQTALLEAENTSRQKLYEAEALEKKVSAADVGLIYYKERVERAKSGDWMERLNRVTGKWEWIQLP
ncbi:MAG: DUF1318 domain-containing protein [Phycisphaerae bacterium]